MIKRTIASILSISLLLSGCAQHQDNSKQNNEQNIAQASGQVLYNVSYASLLALPYTDTSIKLKYDNNELQFGRLYLPKNATFEAPAPLVVFIHGGCWLNTYDISHSKAFSQALAEQGFAVWSLEYRRTGDVGGGWPGSFNDVLVGLSFVAKALNAYPVSGSKIVLAGHSAGGQLALLAGGLSYQQEQPAHNLPVLKGVIGLAAITDMVAYANGNNSCQLATSQFLGGTPAAVMGLYQQASAQQQTMHPATVLLQGTADAIVPLNQASTSGLPFKLVKDAGHFDWIHPQTAAYKQFVQTLQELLAQ